MYVDLNNFNEKTCCILSGDKIIGIMITKQKDRRIYKNSMTAKLIFILSIVASAIWFVGRSIDVYQYAVTGAIFEMIWLPVLASFVVVPIIALLHFRKQGVHLSSFYLHAFLIIAITAIITLIKY